MPSGWLVRRFARALPNENRNPVTDDLRFHRTALKSCRGESADEHLLDGRHADHSRQQTPERARSRYAEHDDASTTGSNDAGEFADRC